MRNLPTVPGLLIAASDLDERWFSSGARCRRRRRPVRWLPHSPRQVFRVLPTIVAVGGPVVIPHRTHPSGRRRICALSSKRSGVPVVLGHSSGAVLSLFAAAEGVPMTHLFLSEPPLRFGQNEPPADLADRLRVLVDKGENEEAVLLFLREEVGMPEPAIEQFRASAAFAGLVPLAQTTVYDNLLVASVSTPTAAMLGVDVPTTLIRGDPTVPLIVTAVERLAAAMPGTELVVVPESHDHGVDPTATVREVRSRID